VSWRTRRLLPLDRTLLSLDAQGARDLAVVRHPLQHLLVDNFISAGATAKDVWFYTALTCLYVIPELFGKIAFRSSLVSRS
jgi:hypothetical protein